MNEDRRSFLKTGAIALAAGAATSAVVVRPAAAQGASPPAAPPPVSIADQPLLKNMTYANVRWVGSGSFGLGVRTDKGVLDVRAAAEAAKSSAPVTVDDLVTQMGSLADLQKLVEEARSGGPAAAYLRPEAEIAFGSVVSEPPKILCIGLNYRAHVAEAGRQVPTTPIFFNKFTTSLNGHGGTVAISRESARNFDYEAELVLVMAKGGRNISEENALDHVFGYAIGQDISARDLQQATSQWMMGKAGDGWGSIGPWLVSADQIDPQNLDISCKVNGETRQSSNTKMMIFNVRQQIAYLSKHLTLETGDVIFTGTPEGVIVGYPKEKQVWLKPGDKLVTTIDKLGEQVVTFT